MVNLTPAEAAEIYSSLQTQHAVKMFGNDPAVVKFKARIEALMEKIGIDGENLITGAVDNKTGLALF